ncbi:hypothetical protein HMF8227_02550 [Saliniradius amylolyticus]|uniref:Phospholipase/carboxylesterase/thioesterase domain-containing protein n=1 Tax=Saliniradius amylolyticus TaxID=2183582 RepID=A0A2S2E644_9ALTE|nr:hypothetical protein [Saliniradius amylolyticus]AWL13002.1 hypothetical protein HMF8227_02550 [Saliniradius amylolyticus]
MKYSISRLILIILVFLAEVKSPDAVERQPDLESYAYSKFMAINETLTIHVSGEPRRYHLSVPEGMGFPEAILFDFHGSGSDPRQHLKISNMQQVAVSLNALLVVPEAARPFLSGGYTWNVPSSPKYSDDVQMVQQIIAQLNSRYRLPELPIFATGFSGGARMASMLACKMSEQIAAVALVAGIRQPELDGDSCDALGTPSILSFHSLDDPINPYTLDAKAKTPPYWQYGVKEAVKAWVKRYECVAKPRVKNFAESVKVLTYNDCRNQTAVISYLLSEGGHTWPGSQFPFPHYLGKVNTDIDGSKLIETFFRERLVLL